MIISLCLWRQVAFVQYSDDARTEFRLNSYDDKGTALSALQLIRYKGGNTKTGIGNLPLTLSYTITHYSPIHGISETLLCNLKCWHFGLYQNNIMTSWHYFTAPFYQWPMGYEDEIVCLVCDYYTVKKSSVSNSIILKKVNIRNICVFAMQASLWNMCTTEWSPQTVEWGGMSRRWWWLLLMDVLKMKCRKMLPSCNMLVRPWHFTDNPDYPITAWAMARCYTYIGL